MLKRTSLPLLFQKRTVHRAGLVCWRKLTTLLLRDAANDQSLLRLFLFACIDLRGLHKGALWVTAEHLYHLPFC